jgi:hypothetical protein
MGLSHGGENTSIRFGNAENCCLIHPTTFSNGELAHWTAESRNCGIITDAGNLTDTSYRDEGATDPYISVVGSAADGQLGRFPEGVQTTVEYASGHGVPILHNGETWKAVSVDDLSL